MPFRSESGATSVVFNNESSAGTNFPIPPGIFTVTPHVFASISSNTVQYAIAGSQGVTPSQGQVNVRRIDGASVSLTLNLRWWAVQQTPTSAAG